ncbi:monosaccharide-sensing protein 2-like [Ananas comosus]|uniref:Monosaccharide-sensing protein 2-like n=1 Tax=Ananas comosus TaxID=4615 RepID=A0A6P5H7L0_ANACO|nr:monosaccharide-sensing protein 2-like [Ananas comosus]XP_020115089.1 monosaccharide-sensing protein 2-like [Ananas comosus]
MLGAVLVAIAASIGNMLQGWDNATIAVAVIYIKKEFKLESAPTIEGLIVAMSLIGATIITTFSGPVSDWVGRRYMLISSSILYFLSGLLMLWSPNVYVLLLGRLIDGFGIGLAVTLVPVYISETAPPEIRGQLNTFPQFSGSGGMFFSYIMVFFMTLAPIPNWRVILGVLFIPSVLYIVLTIFFLPESPRWLVSKGRMNEAKKVLQMLRGREDVSGELALLVEGLGISKDTTIEEYIIGPATDLHADQDPAAEKDKIKLYEPEEGLYWVAQPVGQSTLGSAVGLASRHGSIIDQIKDPIVTLFESVHEKLPDMGSTGSMTFPNFGSMFSIAEPLPKTEHSDEEHEHEEYSSESEGRNSDVDLEAPLISHRNGSTLSVRGHSSLLQANDGEVVNSTGIGGGWQLAWKWSERENEKGEIEGEFKRIYLHQEGPAPSQRGSVVSLTGTVVPENADYIHAAALVSQSALFTRELMNQHLAGPAMVHPSKTDSTGPRWRDLCEPAVKRALLAGVGIQILQQFSGINGVLYYTPQILEQAGVGVLLANMGLSSDSASILISGLTTLLMLPCICVAMRLMDVSGRKSLLVYTIPVLIASLFFLVLSTTINFGTLVNASISTVSVTLYICCFVMGFGPIPNIFCSEIFPTRVRGLCIAICSLTFWFGDIVVTYTLPVMLKSVGLAAVFGFFGVVCCVALAFVIIFVPETKGFPLEVIIEFFNVGAKMH